MKITKVQMQIISAEKQQLSRLRAFVKVTFDDCFLIRGIKIIDGNRLFVAMPARKNLNGVDMDMAFPITSEFRQYIEDVILGEYLSTVGE